MSSTIIINGVTYTGNNIQIVNNNVIIDGESNIISAPVINIEITGDLGSLKCHNAERIQITGSVLKDVNTHNGNVSVQGSVVGNVQTHNGTVNSGTIQGSVTTRNGNINTLK